MKVSTAKIVALRSLNKNIVKELPIWACSQLSIGADSTYLRIAAGLNGRVSSTEAESVFDRAMEELQLNRMQPADAWRVYVVERYQDYLTGSITKKIFLGDAWKACIDQNYPQDLMPLYSIFSGYNDLEKQGWSFDCPDGVTMENVDKVISSEIEKIKRLLET